MKGYKRSFLFIFNPRVAGALAAVSALAMMVPLCGCTTSEPHALWVWPSDKPLPAVHVIDRTTEPLLKADRPWEDFRVNYCCVIRVGPQWHMWYQSMDQSYRSDSDSYLCYARSNDGVHWDKPSLGLYEYHGSKDNNIIAYGIVGQHVFLDPAAPADERFKIVYVTAVDGEWWVFGGTSSDGVHWLWIDEPLLRRNSDTQVACIPEMDRYRLYVRLWTAGTYGGKRAVGYTESAKFGGFPAPTTVLEPDEKDPPDLHFYNSGATKLCEGLYIYWPSAFYTGDQTVRPHLCLSRDAQHLSRIGRTAVINPGKGFDSACLYVAPGAIPADKPGEYWFYYMGTPVGHDSDRPGVVNRSGGVGRFKVMLISQ